MKLELFNEDCMQVMARYPDNYFDLAIVDPPYGIGMDGGKVGDGEYTQKEWDRHRPCAEYFVELLRVSKNQIIWGGNYFADLLPPSMGWHVWDKNNGASTFADGEMAWTSFNRAMRIKKIQWTGISPQREDTGIKIHPCQKPVELYRWQLSNSAKEGSRVLDTHLGSGSNTIAAYEMNMGEFVGCELDPDYFEAAQKRIQKHLAQQKLF